MGFSLCRRAIHLGGLLLLLVYGVAFAQMTPQGTFPSPSLRDGTLAAPGWPFATALQSGLYRDTTANRMGLAECCSLPGAQIVVTALSTPAAPTITTVGAAGATTYTYTVEATNGAGTTVASSGGSTATGNATLSVSNYNTVTWTIVTGATGYKVRRTVGGATQGLIATVTSGSTLTVNDTGLTGDGTVAPTTNTTGSMVLGTPTGGNQGAGTLNALALYVNGVSVVASATPVTSVFSRTGAVVAQSGDYAAAQVTNAFDVTVSNLLTNVAAPSIPAAGFTRVYVDSAAKVLSAKNDAGTVSITVQPFTAVLHQFLTSVSSATGAFSAAQPTCGDLSNAGGGCTMSTAAGGDLAGTLPSPTVAKVNAVAYPASPATNTVPVVTGANQITYEAVPNAALANAAITLNGSSIALGASKTLVLASSDFATQGTTTTVLHGNAAGNPTFSAVNLAADVSGLLPVANGGTALASGTSGGVLGYTAAGTIASSAALTANGFVLGGGAGATPTSTAAPTNGQLPIGQTGLPPILATLTGTANQVVVTNGAGSITFATPQNLHTGATFQVASLGLNVAASANAGTLIVIGTAVAGGATTLSVTPGAHTTVIAESIDYNALPHTITITGGYTTQRFALFAQPTISAATALAITTAATVAIAGAPLAAGAGPAAIINPYALWVQAGNVLFAGQMLAGSTPTTVTDATGKVLSAALNTVAVAQGGTGITSGTSGGVPYFSSTTTIASSPLLTANGFVIGGGAGVAPTSTVAPTNGQIPIGSTGVAPVVAAITGTVNRVTVTNGAGSITLSGPQDLAAGSSPTFTNLTLSGLTANSFLYSGTAGLLTTTAAPTNGQLLIGSTGVAPVSATLTAGTAVSVTNAAGSITITNTGVTSAIGTANQVNVSAATGAVTFSTPQNIHTAATPQFASLGLNVAASANAGTLTATGGANNITLVTLKRFTDTAPTGNFLTLQNAAAATLFNVDITGTVTTGIWTGTAIANAYGGTGQNSSAWNGVPSISAGTWQQNAVTLNGVAYGSAGSAISFTAPGPVNGVLTSGGTGVPPSFNATPTLSQLTLSPASASGAVAADVTYLGTAYTALTASVERFDTNWNSARTVQWAAGALSLQRFHVWQAPTLSFAGLSGNIVTTTATVAITGAPIGGTNATLTNTHALLLQAGAVTGATNAYGLTVNAPTGATNNYAAAFLGGNVGFGTSSPKASVSLGSALGNTKLALFDDGTFLAGFGLQASQFRIHLDQASSRFSFLDAPAGNEVVTILGSGVVSRYKNIATAGNGIPAIYGSGRAVAQTTAVASVATYTVGAADGSFTVSANVSVTASTTHNFTVTVSYTDEGSVVRTLTLTFSQTAGTLLTAITNTQGVGAYEGVLLHIRCKASTAITIATTGTFTSVTYNVEGLITQGA